MGPFDKPVDDEEEQLRQRYQTEADDNSAVDDAASRANRGRIIASIAQAFGGILNGNKTSPNSVYASMHDRAGKQVDDAKAEKKSRLAQIGEMQEQLRQKKADSQKEQEFGWKAKDNDPADASATVARKILAKNHGFKEADLAGMSYAQLKDLGLKASQDKGSSWQMKAVEQKDGTIEWVRFNTDTGETTPTGLKTGYKRTFDGVTGTTVSGADGAPVATPVTTTTGGTLADERTALEGARSYVKGTATQQVKDEQAVQEASANEKKLEDLSTEWLGLYDKASKEQLVPGLDNTGVVGGRVAQAGVKFGADAGPATNEAATTMERAMQQYVVDMTGLSSTDKQFQRLMSTAPHLGMSRPNFIARQNVWLKEVQREAAKKKKMASPVGTPQATASQTATPPDVPPPAPQLSPRDAEMLTKAKAAVADPNTDAATKASAQKVIDRLTKQ